MSQDSSRQPLLDGRQNGDQQASTSDLDSRVEAIVLGEDAQPGAPIPGEAEADATVPEER